MRRLLPAALALIACSSPDPVPTPDDAGDGGSVVIDAGASDAGGVDAGGSDAGAPDADGGGGDTDGGAVDAGSGCEGAGLDEASECRNAQGVLPMACCAPLNCEASLTICDRVPPTCAEGERASVRFSCWGPCVPEALCAPRPQGLCMGTEGTWLETTCGHWRCGDAPACEAIIPGCSCGRDRVFEAEAGCVASTDCFVGLGETCGGRTVSPKTCTAGLKCEFGEGGAIDAPGTCVIDHEFVCSEEKACGKGLSCCYPCGQPGCQYQCEASAPGGGCLDRP